MMIFRLCILPVFICSVFPGILHAQNASEEDTLKVLFGGDTHFTWGVEDLQRKEGALAPVEGVKKFFLESDIKVLNLETAIATEAEAAKGKAYIFRSDLDGLSALSELKLDVAVLANNHASDLGPEGLTETLNYLRRSGIAAVGVGKNGSEYSPFIIETNGIKIGFIAANTIGCGDCTATSTNLGVAPLGNAFIRSVKAAAQKTDFLIVSLHWGSEYSYYPGGHQRKTAQSIINAGADAVIGHHPHIFQGVEVYKGAPVFYSIGNMVFGSRNFQQNHNFLVQLHIDRRTKKLKYTELIPIHGVYRESKNRAFELTGDDRMELWRQFYVLSRNLGSKNHILFKKDLSRLFIFPDSQ